MGPTFYELTVAARETWHYYTCLAYFILGLGTYDNCPYFRNKTDTKVHLYSIAMNFHLWQKPHYRNGTFKEDMLKNLRNVAIPGTGLALSWWCYSRILLLFFLIVINPIISLLSAINLQRSELSFTKILQGYRTQLLAPEDWFNFWRLNCILASYHALVTKSPEYMLENKFTFLKAADQKKIPISPWLSQKEIVIKDKNEEGGMGIFFYKNAVHGGDWIIQERLYNSPSIAALLPSNAPLSTLRLITASRGGLTPASPRSLGSETDVIDVLSCVFRAGRAGSSTDHSSVLFDVNQHTGELLCGTSNSHWYKIGMDKALSTKWTSKHDILRHPDTNKVITGEFLPDMEKAVSIVRSGHYQLLPTVPLVGWDVAITTSGMLILEVNLSCNFFRGSFDREKYSKFADEYFRFLDKSRFPEQK